MKYESLHRHRRVAAVMGAATIALSVGACSSSSKSNASSSATTASAGATGGTSATGATGGSSSGGSGGSKGTITLGFLGDATGQNASIFNGAPGAIARIDQQNAEGGVNGYQLKLVTATT